MSWWKSRADKYFSPLMSQPLDFGLSLRSRMAICLTHFSHLIQCLTFSFYLLGCWIEIFRELYHVAPNFSLWKKKPYCCHSKIRQLGKLLFGNTHYSGHIYNLPNFWVTLGILNFLIKQVMYISQSLTGKMQEEWETWWSFICVFLPFRSTGEGRSKCRNWFHPVGRLCYSTAVNEKTKGLPF